MNELALLPHNEGKLKLIYEKAFREADEIYFATAFLMNWAFKNKLKRGCEAIFVIGEGFHLTRARAAQALQKWLGAKVLHISKEGSSFHPKILAWRTRAKYFALIGSSNMSVGGMQNNREANICVEINEKDWEVVKKWFDEIKKESRPYYEWMPSYKEKDIIKDLNSKNKNNKIPEIIEIKGDKDLYKESYENHCRHQQMFKDNKKELVKLLRKKQRSTDRYNAWMDFRETKAPGFQLAGWTRSAAFKINDEICAAILEVIKMKNTADRDCKVIEILNNLEKNGNHLRNAFFTELLCQFFKNDYFLWNSVFTKTLKKTFTKNIRGQSLGNSYLYMCNILRDKMKSKHIKFYSIFIKDFVQLDAALWCSKKRAES